MEREERVARGWGLGTTGAMPEVIATDNSVTIIWLLRIRHRDAAEIETDMRDERF